MRFRTRRVARAARGGIVERVAAHHVAHVRDGREVLDGFVVRSETGDVEARALVSGNAIPQESLSVGEPDSLGSAPRASAPGKRDAMSHDEHASRQIRIGGTVRIGTARFEAFGVWPRKSRVSLLVAGRSPAEMPRKTRRAEKAARARAEGIGQDRHLRLVVRFQERHARARAWFRGGESLAPGFALHESFKEKTSF
jgi:hypothetical protein